MFCSSKVPGTLCLQLLRRANRTLEVHAYITIPAAVQHDVIVLRYSYNSEQLRFPPTVG